MSYWITADDANIVSFSLSLLVSSCKCISKTSAQQISSLTREPKAASSLNQAGVWLCESSPSRSLFCSSAHLVEFPQILLLCLVDYSQDSGDGLANNTAGEGAGGRISERLWGILSAKCVNATKKKVKEIYRIVQRGKWHVLAIKFFNLKIKNFIRLYHCIVSKLKCTFLQVTLVLTLANQHLLIS